MSDAFFDQFIADLVKGASGAEGFMRGGHINVQVERESRGREEKLANVNLNVDANDMSPGGASLIAGPIGAALSSDSDRRGRGALGSMLGGLGGAAAGAGAGALGGGGIGALIGALTGNPAGGAAIGTLGGGALGAIGGGAAGSYHLANRWGHKGMVDRVRDKFSSLEQHFAAGAKAAAAAFGLKEAFLGMAGSLLGGTAARALGSKVAPNLMKHVGSGMASHAFDAAGSLAGGAIGGRLEGPPRV